MSKFVEFMAYIMVSTIPVLLTHLLKKKHRKSIELMKNKEDNYYYHSIFFNMDNFDCREHVRVKGECSERCSYAQLKTLVNFVASAKISISFCMYMLTIKELNLQLLIAHQRGVKVRLITDKVMAQTRAVQENLQRLSLNGEFNFITINDNNYWDFIDNNLQAFHTKFKILKMT